MYSNGEKPHANHLKVNSKHFTHKINQNYKITEKTALKKTAKIHK